MVNLSPPVPSGKGIYLRAVTSTWLGAQPARAVTYCRAAGIRFACVNRGNHPTARALVAAGVQVWMFDTPEDWTPARLAATLRDCVARVRAIGAAGVLLNLEEGWGGVDVAPLGRALASLLDQGVGVGVVSHEGRKPLMRALAPYIADRAWVSPEGYLYADSTYYARPVDVASAWASLGYKLVCPSAGVLHNLGHGLPPALAATSRLPAVVLWYDSEPAVGTLAAWSVGALSGSALVVALLLVLALALLLARVAS